MRLHTLLTRGFARGLVGGVSAGALLALSACQSQAAHQRDHWNGTYIGPSMSRHFLSYDPEKDGMYRDFQWRKKKNLELTLRRHFFNHNPDNPFHPDDPSVYESRRTHSLVPAPHRYIHIEGLAIGTATLVGGGVFIPVPIDSLIGTFEEGGTDEFMDGVGETFRPLGQITQSFFHNALGFPENDKEAWERE